MKQSRVKSAPNGQFKRRLLHAAMMSAFSGAAVANPSGPAVVNGQVSFNQQGNTLAITNSPNAIINWQSFSINGNETTRFVQQSAASSVLNRVTGIDPSIILGTLQSNGRVFLVNPSGIIFGQGSRVDVAGLVASTLNLNNQDFLAGRLNFTDGALAGRISNQGVISTPAGGSVILVAPQIDNSGIINAPNGDVILAAGRSVRLGDTAAPNVLVEIQAPDTHAVNVGDIVVAGGNASIYAGLIQQKGVVRADTAVLNSAGKIIFKATKDVTLAAGSTTSASGANGGDILIQAESGTTLVNGTVAAIASSGQGGTIHLLGQQVGVLGSATVNASGASGGGSILVGGDYRGANPDIQNARATYFGPDATLIANATDAGDGGRIILWSDQVTRAHGSITAQGGSNGGHGGFVETSGKQALDIGGITVNASAPKGVNGQWLLDPSDVTIIHGSTGVLTGGLFDPATTSSIGDTQINAALNAGTDVTIQTSAGTGGSGSIIVNGSADVGGAVGISNTAGGTRGLTLTTAGTINIHTGALIAGSTGNALNVTLSATGGKTIAGTIDNSGGTTALAGATTLSGTIRNGTLVSSDGSALNSSNGTLDGVTIGGNLSFAGTGTMLIANNLTLADGITVSKGDASWGFITTGSQHLATLGSATITSTAGAIYAGYTVNGQTLQIDSGITLQGSGTLTNSSPAPVINAGTITANTAGVLTVNPANLTNNGSMSVTTGTLNISPSSAFTNSAGASVSAAAGTTLNITPAATFTNDGTVNFSGTTLTLGATNTAWSNSGTVNFNSGTLNLGGVLTAAVLTGGHFIRAAGTTLNFTGTLDNTGNTLDIGSAGLFGNGGLDSLSGTIENGTLVSNDGSALTSSNGTLDGVTIGGNFSFAGTGTMLIANNLTLADGITVSKGDASWGFITTGSQHLATLGSATVTSTAGAIYAGYTVNGQTLQIDSGITLQGSGTLTNSSPAPVINAGTITANTAGVLTVNPANLTNNGSMSVTTGTLNISPSSAFTNSAGASVSAAAGTTLNITPAATFTNDGTVNFSGTTLTLGATNTAWSNSGTVNFNSGTLNLGGVLTAAVLTGGHFIRAAGTTLNFTGTLDNTGNTLDIGSAGLFGNGGLDSLSGTIENGTLVSNDGSALTSSNGTLDGVTIGGNFSFAGTGTMLIANNLTLADGITVSKGDASWGFITTGSQHLATLGSATVTSTAGAIYAGYTVNGQTLQIDSGITLQGSGTLTNSSPAPVINAGTITANTAGVLTVNPANLTNNGSMSVTTGTLNISPSSAFTNSAGASVSAAAGTTLNITPAATFTNDGTVNFSGTTLTLGATNTAWSNSGTVNFNSGTLNLGGVLTAAVLTGGHFIRAAGTTLNFTGTLDNTGNTLDIGSAGLFGNGGLDSLSGTIENGTLVSNDGSALTSSNGTLDGVTIGGNFSFAGTGTMLIANNLTLADGITVSKGGASWGFITTGSQHLATLGSATVTSTAGAIYAGYTVNGQTLQIDSGITLQGSGTLTNSSPAPVINAGTITANRAGTLTINPATFTNNGTISATAGTLSIAPGGSLTSWTNAGTVLVSAGATITTNNRSLVNDGTVGGTGTLNLGAGNALTNRGTLRPGTSPGTLTITGDLELDAANGSITEIEIAGVTAGTQYDQINVSGQVRGAAGNTADWGTLNVIHTGPFTPTTGDSFIILTYASRIGDFTTRTFPAGTTYDTIPNPTSYLVQFSNGATLNSWVSAVSGDWNVNTNWSLGHVPLAGEIAVIPDEPGSITVSVPAGTNVAASVNSRENLTITGGSLALGSGASAVSATLSISGGTFTTDGPLTADALSMSGGTLSGTGNLTVSGASTLTGGTMTGAGSTITQGALTISGNGTNLDGGRVLDVRGGAGWSAGGIQLNGPGAAGSGKIVNRTGSVFDASFDGSVAASNFGGGDDGITALFTNEGTFTKSAGSSTASVQVAFDNSGTVNVQSGTLSLTAGGVHSGSFNVATGTLLGFDGGIHALNNATAVDSTGVIRVSNGTVDTTGTLTNGGELQLTGGTLAAGGAINTARYTQSGGTLSGTGNLTVSGVSTLSGGTMTGAGSTITQGALTISGNGTNLDGGRVLDVRGGASWSAGGIQLNGPGDAGSGKIVNRTGSVFDASFDGSVAASNFGGGDDGITALFTNEGTFTKSAGSSTASVQVAFDNSGTVNVQSGTLSLTAGGVHSGSFNVATGTLLGFDGGIHALNNATAVDSTGVIRVSNGTVDTTGTLTNGGELQLTGGTLAAGGAINTARYTQSGGTLSGTGNLTVSGASTLSGGTMTGAGSTITQGALTISGNGTNLDGGRVLDMRGGASWSAGGIQLNGPGAAGSGKIVNRTGSVFDASFDGSVAASNFGGGDDGITALFTNEGTFTKSAGSSTASVQVAFDNSGTVNVQSGTLSLTAGGVHSGSFNVATGTLLGFDGGAHQLNNATAVDSTGVIRVSNGTVDTTGTLTNGGELQLTGGTLAAGGAINTARYTQSGGTLSGTGNLTVSGVSTLSGGTMTGAGSTITQGALTISGNGTNLDGGRVLDVRGGAGWSAGGIQLNGPGDAGSGKIVNRTGSVFDASFDGSVAASNFGGGDDGITALFTNEGTFTKSAGSSTASVQVAFDNSGTVNVQSGTLSLTAGGVHSGSFNVATGTLLGFDGGIHALNNATAVDSTGVIRVSNGTVDTTGTLTNGGELQLTGGTLAAGGAINTARYTQSGGTLSGTGNLTVSGVSTLSGGTMTGAGSTITQGALTISGNGTNLDGGRVLDVRGGAGWSAGGIQLNGPGDAGSGKIVNRTGSVFDASFDGSVAASNFGGGDDGITALFTNEGTFTKSAGSSTASVQVAFDNSGTVDVQTGTLQITAFASGTNNGIIDVAAGATLSTGGTSLINATTGIIRGAGTIGLGAGTLTNDGTIRPGASPGQPGTGTLTIDGNLTLTPTSLIDIEIQSPGITAGTDFDTIQVTGTAALDGALSATLLGGFVPGNGQNFQVITASSVTGNFSSLNLPSGFNHQVNASNVVLAFGGSACAGTICWDNTSGDGLWTDPLNWNLDVLPGLNDVVVIDLGGGTFVVLDSGTHTIASLLAAEHLEISGGSLSVTGASTFTGGLTVSGGAFTGSGAISANQVSLSSGSFNVVTTALINALNMTGGAVSGTGALTINGSLVATGGTIALDQTTGSLSVAQTVGDLNLAIPVTARTLTARAVRSMIIGGALSSNGGRILLSAGDTTLGAPDPAAALTVNAPLASNSGDITLQNTGSGGINLAADLTAGGGTVRLVTRGANAGGISQGGTVSITGAALGIDSVGSVDLSANANSVARLAASTSGAGSTLTYRQAGSLDIGSVNAPGGGDLFTATDGVKTSNGALTVLIQSGTLTVTNTAAANDVDAGSALVNLQSLATNGQFNIAPGAHVAGGSANYAADDMSLEGTTSVTNGLSISTADAARPIYIGGGTTSGGLGLSSAELDTLSAATLSVGSTTHTGNIEADGSVDFGPGIAGQVALATSGGSIALHAFDVTAPHDLSMQTILGGATSGSVTGSGVFSIGGGTGALGVSAYQGIDLQNPANRAGQINFVNGTAGAGSGSIAYRNNGNLQVVNAVSDAPGGTVSIVTAGNLLLSGGAGVSTTGPGAANITLQSTGPIVNDTPITAGGSGSISLTGAGITNNGTITSPDAITLNAGTGSMTLAGNLTAPGTVNLASTGGGIAQATANSVSADLLDAHAATGISLLGGNVLNRLAASNTTSGKLDIHVQGRLLAPSGDVVLQDIVNGGTGDVNLTIGAGLAYGLNAGPSYSSGGAFNVQQAEMFGATVSSVGSHFGGLSVTGATNTLNTGATLIDNLTLSSTLSAATLGGASTVTVADQFAWYGGVLANTGGVTTNGSTSILRLNPNTLAAVDAVLATNWTNAAGAIAQYDGSGSGDLIISSGRTITNAGQFRIDPVGASTGQIQGTGATFVNQGVLAKDTAVATQLSTKVVNDGGTIASNAGDFGIADLTLQGVGRVQGVAPVVVSGAFSWTGGTIASGTEVDLNGAASISTGVAKTLDGELSNGGTLTILDSIAGAGVLQNTNQMSVTDAAIQPAVINDGLLTIQPGTGVTFGSTLVNSASGTITVVSNATTISNLIVTGDLTNDGLIRLQAGGTGATNAGLGVTTGALTNNGTIQSTGNAGVFFNRLSGNLVNNGTLDASESLRMDNAGFTFTNSSNGNVAIAATKQLFLNGDAAGTALVLDNGLSVGAAASLRLGHVTVTGPGSISNLGTLDISANTDIAGTVSNAGAGSVILVRSLGNSIGTLSNAGTVSVIAQAGLASLDVGNGFTNTGTIEVVAAGLADGAAFGVLSGTLTNSGILRSRALSGTGDNAFAAAITNAGTIDAAHGMRILNAGKVFDTTAGALNVAAGQVLGIDQGTTVVGGGTGFGTGTGTIALGGGALNLASNTTLGQGGPSLQLRTETVNGPGRLINQGTIQVFSTNNEIRAGLDNQSTVTVEPGGSLTLFGTNSNAAGATIVVTANDGAGATLFSSMTVAGALDNAGTLELRSDAANGLNASLLVTAAGTVSNSGTLHSMLTGAGTSQPTSFINPGGTNGTLVNTGVLQVDSPTSVALTTFDTSAGTLQVAAGQTLSLTGGTVVMGAGTSFGTGAGTIDLTGAPTLRLASSMTMPSVATLQFGGNVAITSVSPVTLTSGGALNLANDSLSAGVTLVNLGALTLDATGGAGTLDNRSTVDAFNASTLAALSQTNTGVLTLHGAAAAASLSIASPVVNSGSIVLDAQANGATLTAANGLTNQGSVAGIGTIVVGAGSAGLTNQGTLSPGASPGTLNITGDLILTPTSHLAIELAGAASGEFDAINVSGAAVLAGAVDVSFFGGYIPPNHTQYQVVSAASVTGTFDSITSPARYVASDLYGTNSFTLDVAAAINQWIGLSGFWDVDTNWSFGHAPTASEDAAVDVAGSVQTITIRAGTPAGVASLTVNGEVLDILNSSLGVASFATFDAASVVNVTNSSITGLGLVSNHGVMNLSGASIANPLSNFGTISAAASNNLTGALTTALGSTLRVLPAGVLNVTDGFVNNGLIELQRSGASIAELAIGSETTLVNAGTIQSTGAGTGFNLLQLKNNRVVGSTNTSLQSLASGIVEAQADLLVNHFDGFVEASNGRFDASAGQTLELHNYSAFGGTNVKLGPGTAFGPGTGTIDISDGTLLLTGNLTLPAGGPQFKIRGPSVDGSGFTLTNNGLLTLNGIGVNVPVVNNGTLVADGPRTAGFRNFVTLNNPLTTSPGSTIRIDGGAALATAGGFTNLGTIELNSAVLGTPFDGATLTVTTGTLTNTGTIVSRSAGGTQFNSISAAMTTTGLIDIEHDLSLSKPLIIPNSVTGVAVSGPGNLALANTFTWAGGTIAGPGSMTTSSTSAVNNASAHLDGRNWSNTGTLTINGRLTLDNGAVLTNATGANLALTGTNGNPLLAGLGTAPTLHNLGTLTKTGAAVQTLNPVVDNDGVVVANSQSLILSGGGTHTGSFAANGGVIEFAGGTHTFNAGTSLSGTSELRFTGATADFAAPTSISTPVRVNGGTIAGAGGVTLNGAVVLGGGTFTGTGGLTTSATSSVTVNNAPAFDGGNWTNSAPVQVAGRVRLDNGAVLTNTAAGTITLSGTSDNNPIFSSVAGSGTFNNQGTLTKTSAVQHDITALFNNNGTVAVSSGTLSLSGGGAGGGSYALSGGTSLAFNAGTYTIGSITSIGANGTATVTVAGGTADITTKYDIPGVTTINGGALNLGGTAHLGTLDLASGSLGGAGAVTVGTANWSGGSLGGTGSLTISAFNETGGPRAIASYSDLTLTRQGDFAVGAYTVTNNLSLTASGGSLIVDDVTLRGSVISLTGSNVYLQPGTPAGSAVIASSKLTVNAPGMVLVQGTYGPAELGSTGTVTVNAGSIQVIAGAFRASIDPASLDLTATGDIVLTGGSGSNAMAALSGDNVTVKAANVILTGGAGDGSYAVIEGRAGNATVTANRSIILNPGSGPNADVSIIAPAGTVSLTAPSCTGCVTLGSNPLNDSATEAGLFGTAVLLNIGQSIQVDPSVIYAAGISSDGGQGNTDYSSSATDEEQGSTQASAESETTEKTQKSSDNEEEEEKKQKSSDTQDKDSGSKPKRTVPVCL